MNLSFPTAVMGCALIITPPVFATEISEQQFIRLLLKKHSLFEKSELKLKLKEIDAKASKQSYSGLNLEIGGSLGENYSISSKDTDYSYTKTSQSHIREAYIKLNKKFYTSGIELNMTAARSLPQKSEEKYQYQEFSHQEYLAENKSTLALDFKIPLLKNRGGIIAKKSHEIKAIDYKDEQVIIQVNRNNTVHKNMKIFIDWAYQQELTALYQQQLKALKTTYLSINNAEAEKNKALLQAHSEKIEQNIAQSKSKILAIQKKLSISLQDRRLVSYSPKINWLKSITFKGNTRAHLEKNHPKLQRIAIEKEINQKNITAYKNATLPELNLVLGAKKYDAYGNYSHYSYKKDTDYSVKFEFSYPIFGHNPDKTNLAKARIKTQLINLKYQNALRDFLSELEEAKSNIRLSKEELQDAKQQMSGSKKTSLSELKNYKDGSINIRFLLKAQKDWFKEQLAYHDALKKHRISTLYYEFLTRNY